VAKAERDKAELKYTTAVMDGRVEKVRSPAELLSRHLTRRAQVGNFRVEPPGLFRGRGEHPKMGMIKVRAACLSSVCVPCGPNLPRQRRIQAEDIIINIGKDSPVPAPPPGHSWKAVIHNQYVSWLAGWKDSINTKDWKCVLHPTRGNCGSDCSPSHRYVQLGATSTIKGESDQRKYEKVCALRLALTKREPD